MVAQIAASQLNAHAKAEIAKLLEPGETLDTIASWADDIRSQRRESGPWHYINLPIDVKAGGIGRSTARPRVVSCARPMSLLRT